MDERFTVSPRARFSRGYDEGRRTWTWTSSIWARPMSLVASQKGESENVEATSGIGLERARRLAGREGSRYGWMSGDGEKVEVEQLVVEGSRTTSRLGSRRRGTGALAVKLPTRRSTKDARVCLLREGRRHNL